MTDTEDKSLLNGSSGFISYEESSFSDFTLSGTVDYSYQNKTNEKKLLKKNGSIRRRLALDSHSSAKESDDDTKFLQVTGSPVETLPDGGPVTINGQTFSEETVRVVKYYRKFGDFWNKFPKTDYVYSKSSKWYGVEVSPGIPVIPNMSRRSYRCSPLSCSSPASETSHEVSSSSLRWEYEESLIARTIRIIRRTIAITISTTVKTVYSASSYVSSSVSSSYSSTDGSSLHSSRPILPWFLILLIITPLLYYTYYGTDPPVQDFHLPSFDEALESTCDAVAALSSPYVRLWQGTIWLGSRFLDKLMLIPALLVQPFAYLLQYQADFVGRDASSLSELTRNPVAADQKLRKITFLIEERVKELKNKQDSTDSTLMSFQTKLEELEKKIGVIDSSLMELINEAVEQKLILEAQYQNLNYRQEKTSIALDNVAKKQKDMEISQSGSQVTVVSDDLTSIVQALLDKYHADRIGKTDFALALNGGAIVNIKCTKPYNKRAGQWGYGWGFFFWQHINPPDIIIKPGSMPGECWAFEGAVGYVVIKLAIPIYVTGFSMEHAPKELSPFGHIKSAPRTFSVWGLETKDDYEEQLLGRYEFLDNGQSLQSYEAIASDKPFIFIELRIESNHGDLEYTCLYRFRIHGRPAI